MRRFGLMAAVLGLLLAVCVPARAESEGAAQDEVAMAMATAKARAKAAAQKEQAIREAARSAVRKAGAEPSDTIVVAAAGPDQPGFTMVGENVTYTDPSFVPYKLREAARRARANADLASIP